MGYIKNDEVLIEALTVIKKSWCKYDSLILCKRGNKVNILNFDTLAFMKNKKGFILFFCITFFVFFFKSEVAYFYELVSTIVKIQKNRS